MSKTIAVMTVGVLALAMTAGALASQSSSPFAGASTLPTTPHWSVTLHTPVVDPTGHPHFGLASGHGAGILTPNSHNFSASAATGSTYKLGSGQKMPGTSGEEPRGRLLPGVSGKFTGHEAHGPATGHVSVPSFNAPHH